jgi:hypothetical protein
MYPDVADDYREARRMRAEVVARSAGGGADDDTNEGVYRRFTAGHPKVPRGLPAAR